MGIDWRKLGNKAGRPRNSGGVSSSFFPCRWWISKLPTKKISISRISFFPQQICFFLPLPTAGLLVLVWVWVCVCHVLWQWGRPWGRDRGEAGLVSLDKTTEKKKGFDDGNFRFRWRWKSWAERNGEAVVDGGDNWCRWWWPLTNTWGAAGRNRWLDLVICLDGGSWWEGMPLRWLLLGFDNDGWPSFLLLLTGLLPLWCLTIAASAGAGAGGYWWTQLRWWW